VGIESQLNWLGKLNRPAKSDLDSNWRSINYCAIDLETTGLDFDTDEIISIGAAQIQSSRVITEANYYREVRPTRDPSSSSIRIHGIRAVDLAGASLIDAVIPEFAELLRGRVVVAHAAWVEKGFLRERLENANLDFSKRVIDTASLARRCAIVEDDIGHEPSLELLARTLKLPVYSPHHALGDALTTAIVFLALATELERRRMEEDGSVLTLRELLKMSGKSARTQW
jgi:DNA polymerase III subunit epsilon